MATLFGFGDDHSAACDGGLEAFAARRPEFGVTEVKNATMASDESKNKLLDTAKAHFFVFFARTTVPPCELRVAYIGVCHDALVS